MKRLLLGLLVALMACNTQNASETTSIEMVEVDSSLLKAKTHFENYCSSCHGAQMQAFVDREWKYGNSPDSLTATLLNGRAEGAMPAFAAAFNEEDLSNLVSYIRDGIENVDKYVSEETILESDTFHTAEFSFHLDTIISGMDIPWGMTFLENDEMLVTEKSGKLYKVGADRSKTEIEGVPPVRADGQGGLLDVELHPDYADNGLLYLSYSILKREEGDTVSTTAVSRYRLEGNRLVDGELIFEAMPYLDTKYHYGSRLEFDPEGYLYISVGDRAKRDDNPQSLENSCGKIHRVYDDGRVPEDNPFVGQSEAVASIYSYGHRNPQGVTLHPETGKIWTHEHGPRGGDELNIVDKGSNYGWPVISYGINYDATVFTEKTEAEGMLQPLHYWVPSIAPCGMDFVEGDKYPGWDGHLMVGSLRFEYLNLCRLEGDNVVTEEILMKNIGRVRNVRQGPDGYLYVAVEDPGYVFKLIPLFAQS